MDGRNGGREGADPRNVGSASSMGLAVVFFDYDSTLTIPQYIKRANKYALADNPKLFAQMSEEEVFANFGGRERVQRLAAMLHGLVQNSIELFIISLGFRDAILQHLSVVGLTGFFPPARVFGQDSRELFAVGFRKARLIQWLLERHGWSRESALFVDDDNRHISLCRELQACPCLKVRDHGLNETELQAIEARAKGKLA
eukprot:CAMPEP_0179138724 /NCGR_PEP_ID=MMETSP0796-20121207/66276_1 /TAXON_ID=73915 /ORGANISM="Pyrodinium bahamense, Strain pbaha01" /LENGTH=199 /DNA_ID=CAMNT_0020838041 /DNA_START=22 /DNA_END=618 /DNA_ORIENTATION=-